MFVRFDPFRDFDRLTRNVAVNSHRPWMSMDAYRQDDHVVVNIDLPGIDPSSVEVTVEKGTLTVKAERSWETAEGSRVLLSERPQGTFTRRLHLSDAFDGDRTEARYDNGVLTLTIPVAEQAKARRVEITSGSESKAVEGESVAA
jgi:HSP20 family protein